MENKDVILNRNINFKKIPDHCKRWRLKSHTGQEKTNKQKHQLSLITESCVLLPLQPFSGILICKKYNWNEHRKVPCSASKGERRLNVNKHWMEKNKNTTKLCPCLLTSYPFTLTRENTVLDFSCWN